MTGRVVILNGASSTGKTSLAGAFHDLRAASGEFWFRLGVDDVLSRVTSPWLDVGWPTGPGEYAADGLRTVPSAGGPALEVGPLLRELLETHQDWAARIAARGST